MSGTWQSIRQPRFRLHWRAIPIDQRQIVISDSYVVNPRTINEVRLGWNRRKLTRLPPVSERTGHAIGIPNVGPETMPIFGLSSAVLTADQRALYFRFPEGETVDVNRTPVCKTIFR